MKCYFIDFIILSIVFEENQYYLFIQIISYLFYQLIFSSIRFCSAWHLKDLSPALEHISSERLTLHTSVGF